MRFVLYFFLSALCGITANAQLINNNILLSQGTVYVVSAEDATPISVAFDTPFASISKASSVNITTSTGAVLSVPVSWNEGLYDQDAPGDYDVFGDLTLPPGVANPFLISGHVVITVQPEIFTVQLTITGFQTWEVPDGVTELIYAEGIAAGGAGGGLGSGAAGSAGGGGGGAYARGEELPVTAGELVCVYVPSANPSPVPSGSPVNGPDGKHFFFGPAAPAGSTVLSGSGAPGGGTGADGNYYFDIDAGQLYGPKASGSWPGSPASTWVKAEGGKGGTAAGVGGAGGATANSVGDVKYAGGNGTNNAASRSGAGGGGAGKTGAGGNGQIISGTNVVGGTGNSPGGNGGNGSSGASDPGDEYGGGGGGRRTTSAINGQGGAGEKGICEIQYTGATTPPPDPGDAYIIAVWGQSNMCSPGNGSPTSQYLGPHDTKIWINSTTGFEALEYNVNNNPGGSPTGLGPELSIAEQIGDDAPGETYIVKKAQSGTNMYTNWNVANNSTGRSAVSQLVDAGGYLLAQAKDIKKIYIVFRQGEADRGPTNPNGPDPSNVEAEYKDKFQDLIQYTIEELESELDLDMTVIELYVICVLVDDVTSTFTTEIVNAQTDALSDFDTDRPSYASKFAGGYTISSVGWAHIDAVHFTTAYEIQMGLEAAALMTIP